MVSCTARRPSRDTLDLKDLVRRRRFFWAQDLLRRVAVVVAVAVAVVPHHGASCNNTARDCDWTFVVVAVVAAAAVSVAWRTDRNGR